MSRHSQAQSNGFSRTLDSLRKWSITNAEDNISRDSTWEIQLHRRRIFRISQGNLLGSRDKRMLRRQYWFLLVKPESKFDIIMYRATWSRDQSLSQSCSQTKRKSCTQIKQSGANFTYSTVNHEEYRNVRSTLYFAAIKRRVYIHAFLDAWLMYNQEVREYGRWVSMRKHKGWLTIMAMCDNFR